MEIPALIALSDMEDDLGGLDRGFLWVRKSLAE
jgi:hypothetical protein